MAQSDDVQGIVLRLTEEDIRQACELSEVPFAGLVAIWRRFRSQDEAIQMADVLYMMALAKSKNLNPLDNNYALIPRPDNRGFSLTFTKDAALQVITKHPKVKFGTMKRWFVTGTGEKLSWDKSPSFSKLSDVDWALEAHVTIEDENGESLEGVARYRNSCACGKDGNPKYLWMKDSGGMLMKQAYKDLANSHLGGGLPDEEEVLEAQRIEGEPLRSLPAAPRGENGGPAPAPTPVSTEAANPVVSEETIKRVIAKGAELGLDEGATLAAWKDQITKGITIEAFEKSLDAEIEKRKPKAATRAPRKPKAPPKPVITVIGTIDGIADKKKVSTNQKYLVLSVQGIDVYVWDTKLHELCRDGYENGGEFKVSYVISGDESDPANQFADLKEIERVETKPAEAPAEQSASEAGTTPEPGPAEGFSMETEYLDPEESKCAECGSSFGIHLKTCSQFKDPNAPAAEKPKAEPKDNGPLPLFAW